MFLPIVNGQEIAKRYFQRALHLGRLSHAYLFLGPEGAGKRQFARELSKVFFCETGSGCGQCAPCLRIEHGNHPSVEIHSLMEGKSLIDIDTVRALCTRAYYKADRIQIAVLEQAELLSEPAANALLKTLEEPPSDFILILTAQSSGTLLPTVVSRCHRILFTGPRAYDVPAGRETLDRIAEVVQPGFFANSDPREWLSGCASKDLGVRGQVRHLLDQSIHAGRIGWLSAIGVERDRSIEHVERLLELRQDLDRNVNPDLVLEACIRELRAERRHP